MLVSSGCWDGGHFTTSKYIQIEIQGRYATTPKEFFVRADRFSSLPGWHSGFIFFLVVHHQLQQESLKSLQGGGSLAASGSATRTTLLVSPCLTWVVALEKQVVKTKETTSGWVGGRSQREKENNISSDLWLESQNLDTKGLWHFWHELRSRPTASARSLDQRGLIKKLSGSCAKAWDAPQKHSPLAAVDSWNSIFSRLKTPNFVGN